MNILLSSGSVISKNPFSIFKIAADLEVDGIEIIASNINSNKELEIFNDLQKSYHIKIKNVHMLFFGNNITKYFIRPHYISWQLLKKSVEITKKLKANTLVIHPFPAFFFKKKIKTIMNLMINKLKDYSFEFSIENLEKRNLFGIKMEPYCISNYDELYEFAVNNDIKMTLDTSHCISKGINPVDFFEKYKKTINNIHVSNYRNWQAHYPLNDGIINFKDFFHVIQENDYNGYITLEIDPVEEKEIERNINYIRKCLI